MIVQEIVLHLLKLPLVQQYQVAHRVFDDFDPIFVEIRDRDGAVGWGEGHISPGYSHETIEGGWTFCREQAAGLVGLAPDAARAKLAAHIRDNPVAATAMITALEMLERNPLLQVERDVRIPLLDPINAKKLDRIAPEVETLLGRGFRTLKVKVGWDVDDDLARLAEIQRSAGGRAELRLDANRGYDRNQGRRFAQALDPAGIQLFEQPCASDDWDANAAVAAVSKVPVMLDESIYGPDDIERAGTIKGVGFVKLKLKKVGGLDLLKKSLDRIRALGMRPVLGDGVSSELQCWMEACVARVAIDNAGEMNGFLKPRTRLLAEPLAFDRGAVVLPRGYWPEIDRARLTAHTVKSERFAAAQSALRANA